ncbi:hypothetical protein ATCC90586_000683 [Pythium insidiosum]|nr:hypothetical protein ATCC90586_000683 [Pythium insidiosum]
MSGKRGRPRKTTAKPSPSPSPSPSASPPPTVDTAVAFCSGYLGRETLCRNPFCRRPLVNPAQAYCESSRFCQLRRGLILHCAWPKVPDEDAAVLSKAFAGRDATATATGAKRKAPTESATTFIADEPSKQTQAVTPSSSIGKRARTVLRNSSRGEDPPAVASVKDGVAQLIVADREWLQCRGNSTTDLYQQVLEDILLTCESWREVAIEMKTAHSDAIRRYGRERAIPGVSFLKLWQAMKEKHEYVAKAALLVPQTVYYNGASMHHYSLILGPVEIGSGSHAEAMGAFHAACSAAFEFLMGLTVYAISEKKKIIEDDKGLGSWSEPAELNANFSPSARSEPSDKEDSMSISDDDDHRAAPATSSDREAKSVQPLNSSTAPTPPAPEKCVFCEEMKAQSGRSKCLRCERGRAQLPTSTASASSNRNVEALHAFLRQASTI